MTLFFRHSSPNTTTGRRRPTLVPTLRVGMPGSTLRVASLVSVREEDAERPRRHSHAERGNEEATGGGVERGVSFISGTPSPSVPMAAGLSPRVTTVGSSSGTWKPAARCTRCWGTAGRLTRSPSAPTVIASPRAGKTARSSSGTPTRVKRFSHSGGTLMSILGLAFSPDGNRTASASTDTTVKMWDISSPTPEIVDSPPGPCARRAAVHQTPHEGGRPRESA